MSVQVSRRWFMQVAAAGCAGLAVADGSALRAADAPPKRKFTMALSCGAIGVKATPARGHRIGPAIWL